MADDVTIVPWYPSVAKPFQAGAGSTEYSTLTHVPEARADILWDGSDSTYIDTGDRGPDMGGKRWTGDWHADALTPATAIPAGQPVWATYHLRLQARDGTSGRWFFEAGGRGPNGEDYRLWAGGPDGRHEGPGIYSDSFTFYRERGISHEGPGGYDDGWGVALDIFARGWDVSVPGAGFFDTGMWCYEAWAEVAYEGAVEFPLRQVQRDDHLAAGSPRATAGTSRQGSIRQRGYE